MNLPGTLGSAAGASRTTTSKAARHGHHHRRDGIISGYVLKCIRESLRLTQEALAETLRVDGNTIQGWETGRRSLSGTQAGKLSELRRHLRGLGAAAPLLTALGNAMDADFILDHALRTDANRIDLEAHPLATWVLPRATSEMLAWPLTGEPPAALPGTSHRLRRGPVSALPSITAAERARFFEHFRMVAERSLTAGDCASVGCVLLRRQAYYQLAWSPDESTRAWLQDAGRQEQRAMPWLQGWSPRWVAARSLAVAQARVGDRDPLLHFIRSGFESDACELANLNYWAYWVGEATSPQHADRFMAGDLASRAALSIVPRLEPRLVPSNPCIDLSVHTMWALFRLASVRHLLIADRDLSGSLRRRTEHLLDHQDVSEQSSHELNEIRCGILTIEPARRPVGSKSSRRARQMPEDEIGGLARYAYEMGQLKRSKRTGWWLAGISDPESVAEHSFRTALLGYVLALMEGADPARTAALCLFHDTAETRLGDIPSVGKQYLIQAPPADVIADQVACLPRHVAEPIAGLTAEYVAQGSREARVARDADKLECLLQAREYEAQGYRDAASWIAPSAASIQTASGRQLAEACQTTPPRQWWKSFVESYIRAAQEPPAEAEDGGPAVVAQ